MIDKLALLAKQRPGASHRSIPDNDLNGYQSSQVMSGFAGNISQVTVNLKVSGGFNGDLYISLAHNHALAVLVNRVGLGSGSSVGYPDRGFDVTLADNATEDIHFYQAFPYVLSSSGQLMGTWQPDGRSLDPMSPGLAFVTANRDNRLNIFEGADPNGVWTLFAADLSAGGLGTLDNWTLDISVVPEPAPTLLFLCGLAGIAARKLASLAKSRLH